MIRKMRQGYGFVHYVCLHGGILLLTLLATHSSAFHAAKLPLRRYSTTTAHQSSQQLLATVNIDENAPRDIATFDQWATNCGVGKADGLQLLQANADLYSGNDIFVVTSQDVPAGSPVLYVPAQMILSSVAAEKEFRSPCLTQAEEQLKQEGLRDEVSLFRLFVKILSEYEAGEESPYYPWLNALPRQFFNGVSMTDACFTCLPPYVSKLAEKERDKYKTFHKVLLALNGPHQLIDEYTVADKDLIKWAYNIALTRHNLVGTRELRISPLADFIQHGAVANVDISYDNDGNCLATAVADIPAGSPLQISLGDSRDPSPIFAKYGSLDETSPATYCKLLHLKKEMKELRYEYGDLLFGVDGEVYPAVYDVLLYSVLSFDASLQQQFYKAVMAGDESTKNAMHQEYMPYTIQALQEHIDGTLALLDELSARASTLDVATHPRVPLILRHNDFVRRTFLNVKQNVDAMAAQYQ